MDKELIERLGRECAVWAVAGQPLPSSAVFNSRLTAFAALIAEECAKLCESIENGSQDNLTPWAPHDIREKFCK